MKKVSVGKATLFADVLPDELIPDTNDFQVLWDLHPSEFSRIKMYDKEVYLPRWQQSFGKDYYFSGQVSSSLPTPKELQPYLDWARELNPAYNGLLLNWYDSDKKHYIGRHRDSEVGMVRGAPIITISIGATRIFRMRECGEKGFDDLEVKNGDIIVIPRHTNQEFTHEVPYLGSYPGKRVSITIRAFND
jgi:alkylated DNA repair dioxygenase AlkB